MTFKDIGFSPCHSDSKVDVNLHTISFVGIFAHINYEKIIDISHIFSGSFKIIRFDKIFI